MALPIARRATRVSLPLVGAFMVGAIAYGGLYTFPAISIAFADEFGISRTLAVTPWTMFLLVTALASPLIGRAYDEFADRDLLTASMVLLAAGWLAVYLAGDISLVILAYAVFMAIGLQLAFIGTSTAVARRYAGMSGLALGIAYAGPGIGVAVALPVAAGLIQTAGWRETALVFMASSLVGVLFVWMMTSGPAIVVPAPRARPARAARAGQGRPRQAADPIRPPVRRADERRPVRAACRRIRRGDPGQRPPRDVRPRRRVGRPRDPAGRQPGPADGASGARSGPVGSGSCSPVPPPSGSSTRASCRRSSRVRSTPGSGPRRPPPRSASRRSPTSPARSSVAGCRTGSGGESSGSWRP